MGKGREREVKISVAQSLGGGGRLRKPQEGAGKIRDAVANLTSDGDAEAIAANILTDREAHLRKPRSS